MTDPLKANHAAIEQTINRVFREYYCPKNEHTLRERILGTEIVRLVKICEVGHIQIERLISVAEPECGEISAENRIWNECIDHLAAQMGSPDNPVYFKNSGDVTTWLSYFRREVEEE